MTSPTVRVIVVNYKSRKYLERCLQALLAQTYEHFEVVLVDNGSGEESLAPLLPRDQRFSLLELPDNVGFAAGNNIGAKGSSARWIATLNPDAFPAADWLER